MDYRINKVRLSGWCLPTRQPKVLIAQLRTAYREPAGDDKAIRVQDSEEYQRKLEASVDALIEQNGHVLVFPEYSWPYESAEWAVQKLLKCLPEGAVCALPFEHLTL